MMYYNFTQHTLERSGSQPVFNHDPPRRDTWPSTLKHKQAETEVLWNNTFTRCNALRSFLFHFKSCWLQPINDIATLNGLRLIIWKTLLQSPRLPMIIHYLPLDVWGSSQASGQSSSLICWQSTTRPWSSPSNPAPSLFFLSLNSSFSCSAHLVATSHMKLWITFNFRTETHGECNIYARFQRLSMRKRR